MAGSRRGTNAQFEFFESIIAPIGDTIDIVKMDVGRTHCFAAVRFFADAAGTIEAIPTAGFVNVAIQTLNNSPRYEDPPSKQINAAAPTTISWAANTQAVRAVPTDLNVATHWQLVITCNES